jgi:hypothetical protein
LILLCDFALPSASKMDVTAARRKPLGNEASRSRAVFNYSNEKLGRKKLTKRFIPRSSRESRPYPCGDATQEFAVS